MDILEIYLLSKILCKQQQVIKVILSTSSEQRGFIPIRIRIKEVLFLNYIFDMTGLFLEDLFIIKVTFLNNGFHSHKDKKEKRFHSSLLSRCWIFLPSHKDYQTKITYSAFDNRLQNPWSSKDSLLRLFNAKFLHSRVNP
ncbi:hypothetical protein O6H91_15G038800 [Diphasiastrum complanatum]|uniref:Uncharacterized protein n=1 Tax=Diphasiastrum complanatum TaxID=34168 RepID=A0ACC2BHN9_DIPCM|nr:hypothetical protein O6H91_15G038800 [Diphasiastrum complanatum]